MKDIMSKFLKKRGSMVKFKKWLESITYAIIFFTKFMLNPIKNRNPKCPESTNGRCYKG